MWFIAFKHSTRPDEGGIKFVANEAATVAAGRELEASGYVIKSIGPTSQARMDAFLAGTVSDPEQPLLG
jgi:tartrate dehydratase beta subunit/fumarate hydratase class I family protein